MTEAALAAMSQIENKKHTSEFKATGGKIWKVALVVSYRADVKVVIREAANWRLASAGAGMYRIEIAAGNNASRSATLRGV
jgi:hypothetical protein